jgi:hypothetical protein
MVRLSSPYTPIAFWLGFIAFGLWAGLSAANGPRSGIDGGALPDGGEQRAR